MNTKLTLSLKKSIIEKAKQYAKGNNQSLSQIIESYLERITDQKPELGDPELDAIRGLQNCYCTQDFQKSKIPLSSHPTLTAGRH